jgi:hypothetical protein
VTPRPRIREAVDVVKLRQAVNDHPALPKAISEIIAKTHLPEEIARQHLDAAVLEILDVLGAGYVREMGEAVGRVEVVRRQVHAFYEGVLSGADRSPDPAALRTAFERLHEAVRELVGPDEWARRKLEERAADPMAALQDEDVMAGEQWPQPGPQPHPAPAPPPPPPPRPPRGSAARGARRQYALPPRLRSALARARQLHPDLIEAVIRGEAGASERLQGRLRQSGLSAREARDAVTAATAVAHPDPAYALGGRTGGKRAGDVATVHAFDGLPGAQRDVVRRAADADPDFVRSIVTSEITYGPRRGTELPWRPEEMDGFCADHGIQGQERADLETALKRLNDEHRRSLVPVELGGTGTTPVARARAAQLDTAATRLGLPATGEIAAQLARHPYLREIAAASPDHLLELASMWLRYAERKAAEGKPPSSLDAYVRRLMSTQVRGLAGERTAVFGLGNDFWVLKAPDLRVTDPGTDFVVVARRSGEIWFCDNKALSDAGLSGVSSLVRNIEKNMAADVAEFGPEIEQARVPVPPAVADAVARARTASSRISALVGQLSREERARPDIQAEITRICDRHGVRRVVTNAGGELTTLGRTLTDNGIDLADLEHGATVLPTRDLAPPTGTPEPSAGGGTP